MACDVRYTSSLHVAVLLGSIACFACSGAPAQSKDTTAADQQEQSADRAFEAAQSKDTIEAYEAVMKRFEGTDAAGRARIEVARKSSELARVAVGRGDWEDARLLATRALELGDPIIAQSARSTLEQVDRADAREATERVKGALDMDASLSGCAKAIGIVGKTMGDAPSKILVRDLHKSTLQQLTTCMQSAIEAAKPNDDFAPVRKVLEGEDAKRAYGEEAQFSLLTNLNNAVVASMNARTQADVDAGRWQEAFATFDAWAKDGKAGPQQVEAAKQHARDTITTSLLEKGRAALGKPAAAQALSDANKALEVFKGMNVSADLVRLRDHLASWEACRKLRCLAERAPAPMFNFGAAGLHPPTDPSATATTKLPNGTKVWVLARSTTFSLVTDQDPGEASTWEQRFLKAKGWIDTKVLERVDTSAWLPVGQALVGERVWLPTGRDDKLYLLGEVKGVNGQEATVEKISDGQSVTVKRNDLRSGVLAQGTKVLAFCRDTINMTEARLEGVEVGGRAPRADLVCLEENGSDGRKRQEQLGALRAKVEWLPPRRP